MEFLLSTKVTGAEVKGKDVKNQTVTVNFESVADGTKASLQGDKVLVSVGRKPYTEGLGSRQNGR